MKIKEFFCIVIALLSSVWIQIKVILKKVNSALEEIYLLNKAEF